MTTETTHALGMLCDYATSTPIRPATAIEWRKSADAELEGGDVHGVFDLHSGAFRDDGGHTVIVIGGPPSEVTADDIRALGDDAASAGDLERVRLCEVATGDAADSPRNPRGFAQGNGQAFRQCAKVILDSRMTMAAWAAQTEDSLYAAARNAATMALKAYSPDSDRLPFPDPGMYGDDLKRAFGSAERELNELEFSWKDGYCGSPEFRRAKSVLYWAWILTANARTWAGRTDAGLGIIDAWKNLLSIAANTGDQT
jgi:hypothetical protein